MKLILNIDEKTLKNMQGYATQNNVSLDDVVTNLFNTYIQEPATAIDEIHAEKGNLSDLEDFSKLLMDYVNEAIYDIEESAESQEAYKTDEVMAKVFRKLNRDHLNRYDILTDLYKVYKEGD